MDCDFDRSLVPGLTRDVDSVSCPRTRHHVVCACGYEDLYTVKALSSYVTALRPKEVSYVQPDLHLLYMEIFMVHSSTGLKNPKNIWIIHDASGIVEEPVDVDLD